MNQDLTNATDLNIEIISPTMVSGKAFEAGAVINVPVADAWNILSAGRGKLSDEKPGAAKTTK